MRSIPRKSAMRVRGGRVAKKNNWVPDHRDYYARPQTEIQIERTHPGPGYRHVVNVSQLRRFLALLPDWEELAIGLKAISIYKGGHDWIGLCNPGVVVITAWEQDLWWLVDPEDVDEVRDLLDLLMVEIVPAAGSEDLLELRWTEAQARGFMLLDVLCHELGHHHDRMTGVGTTARRRRGRAPRRHGAPRGEPYAIEYARRVQAEVWPAYVREFAI